MSSPKISQLDDVLEPRGAAALSQIADDAGFREQLSTDPGAALDESDPTSGEKARVPGPSVVELEVCSRCNRACSYCPVSLNPRPKVPVRMSDEVFRAAIGQLADISFSGRISYHLYNEPLLRKDLPRLVQHVNTTIPDALQLLNTNGDLLDDGKYAELRRAGMDYFYVTRHSEGPYPDREFQIVQYSQDLTLTNRGGTLEHLPSASAQTARTPCFAPSEMLIVTVAGDVLLCYEDAERGHVLGNVLDSSISEIWVTHRFNTIRARLRAGDRSVFAMCSACSNVSHHRPGLSALEDPVLRSANLDRSDADAVSILKQRSISARLSGI
ncbi:SPASM domain-containing protein [Nocardia sp. R7R-8]|uniref:SPASM domain-containing protein n=1 Tax=Nocardia sp. R7R-8 TaxID=3459304 RepID=UPI00403E354F